ncbi:hypothetical protein I553_10423, partial [Mycobacterium xenopi 4042]
RLKASRLDNSTEAEIAPGSSPAADHRRLRLQPMDATATADFYELVVAGTSEAPPC